MDSKGVMQLNTPNGTLRFYVRNNEELRRLTKLQKLFNNRALINKRLNDIEDNRSDYDFIIEVRGWTYTCYGYLTETYTDLARTNRKNIKDVAKVLLNEHGIGICTNCYCTTDTSYETVGAIKEPHCVDCLHKNEKLIKCSDCNTWHEVYYMNRVTNQNNTVTRVCDSCSNNYTSCYGCNNRTINTVQIGDYNFCSECSPMFRLCDHCGDDITTNRLCDFCERIKTRKNKKFKKCKPSKLLKERIPTGIELELEHSSGDDYEARDVGEYIEHKMSQEGYIVSAVEDGSLSYGMEFVSGVYYGKELEELIKSLTAKTIDNNFEVRTTCGLHVHLNACSLTENQVKKMYRYYMLFEHFLYNMLPNSRQHNNYCLKVNNAYNHDQFNKRKKCDKALYKTDKTKGKKTNRYCQERYFAMNIHSYYYRGSIEFRHHHATQNPTKIINWIRILHSMYKNGKDITHSEITKLSKLNNSDLLHYFKTQILIDSDLIQYYEGRCDE